MLPGYGQVKDLRSIYRLWRLGWSLWEEDEERAFVIDPYASEQLKDFDWSGGSGFADYWPTCRGEELDFWFERVLELDDQGQPHVFVQLNG